MGASPDTLHLVIPTSELVREFWYCEPLLCFYEEGVRGLIRDAVLLSRRQPSEDFSFHRHHQWPALFAEGLMDRVLAEFERSMELRFLENTLPLRAERKSLEVESVVEAIDEAVARMLRNYLHKEHRYEISKRRWRWVGYDMLLWVHLSDA